MLGDREMDLTDGFNLFITTKMANPSYSPEISARCAIIDFTVTMKGLEDQLLATISRRREKVSMIVIIVMMMQELLAKKITSIIVRMSTMYRWRQCLKDLLASPTGRRSAGAH